MTDGWTLAIVAGVGLLGLDRLLRWLEGRGWIYYRKTKPGRSAVAYHILEMSSVFDPSFEVVQEIQVKQEKDEEEAGGPVVRRDSPGLAGARVDTEANRTRGGERNRWGRSDLPR